MTWLLVLVTVLHVTVCMILILSVLLQKGSKADLGVFGGAGTQTAFGGAGPASFLYKITVAAAALFMITCVFLAINAGRVVGESDVTKRLPSAQKGKAATPAPTMPTPAPPAPGTSAPSPATPGTPQSGSGATSEKGQAPATPPSGGETKKQ